MMNLPTLWVVLPIYNEAAAIKGVVEEWVEALRSLNVSFAILAIDDGSKDHTAAILKSLGILELQIIQRQNSGHGPSCRFGYQTALEQGAGWVLQIDSDGQCDPRYFPRFWEARQSFPVIFGCRTKRDDGWSRWWISRVVSLVVFLATGEWIKDANVPYRLMLANVLKPALEKIPENAFFANILLSSALAPDIRWEPMRFRKRSGGSSMLRWRAMLGFAQKLFGELRVQRSKITQG